MPDKKGIKVISGSSNPILSEDIVQLLKTQYIQEDPQIEVISNKFADGETNVQISDNVRGYDVFVVQSLSYPVNDNLVELLFILDALKRSDVRSVTVVIPYYGYARQDRKSEPRVPISAKVVADMIQVMDINRIVTIDLHAGQIQGFFNCPVDNLYASKVLIDHMKSENGEEDICVVSPDKGGTERATYYSERLNAPMAICYKHRNKPGEVSHMGLLGNVENKKCIIVDDIADSCGTLVKASNILKEKGAKDVVAYVTHGIFSKDAIEKLDNSPISQVNVTDTIPLSENVLNNQKFNVITVADLLARSIFTIFKRESISKLFI